MYALFAGVGVLVAICIIDTYFNIPVIERLHSGLERLFTGKGYLRFFGLTAVFAALVYGVGELLLAPFLGMYQAGIEVGTAFVLIFMGSLLMNFFSFGRDVYDRSTELFGAKTKVRPGTSMLYSTIFVTSVWGCAILLTFYDHSVSGTLVGVSVNI